MIIILIIILILIIIITLLWMRFISTKGLITKRYDIYNKHIDNFKIVHFTDLHYGSTVHSKEIKKLVNKINEENADVVVFTGDMFERNVILSQSELDEFCNIMNNIKCKYHVLYVPGNHDFDCKAYYYQANKKLNWTLLKNSNILIDNILFIGIDDLLTGKPDYSASFKTNNTYLYKIVLLHEPDQIDKVLNYKFDLALAGHSHLGQVRLPIIGTLYTPIGAKKYREYHYKLPNNSEIYISGGIGTSDKKIRFFNKPSINIYNLKKYSK